MVKMTAHFLALMMLSLKERACSEDKKLPQSRINLPKPLTS